MKERGLLFKGPMAAANVDGRKTQTRRIIKFPANAEKFTADKVRENEWRLGFHYLDMPGNMRHSVICPYGSVGSRIWQKETFQFVHANSDGQRNIFRAASAFSQNDYRWIEYAATPKDTEPPPTWKPSIFMPRWASRFVAELTAIRVGRVQDISEDDAIAEGVPRSEKFPQSFETPSGDYATARVAYQRLWNSINLKPKPVSDRRDGKMMVVRYESYPWSLDDFTCAHPGILHTDEKHNAWRGLPLVVVPNPYVWILEYKRITP